MATARGMGKFRLLHYVTTPVLSAYRTWSGRTHLPNAAKAMLAEDRRGLSLLDPGPAKALEAGVRWLCRAQDFSRTADGGFARDFSLIDGWSASYPETTGYIIPTLIAAGKRSNDEVLILRARRALDWLMSIQLSQGAFQGGRIDQRPVVPVTFNTGQVLLGLAAGAEELGEARYRTSMVGAADFLRDTLDADGCWRRYPSPFAGPGEKAYETHASWGLFEAARIEPHRGYGEAGLKQVEWALSCQQANGWFESNCLDDPDAPLTHTIGYVLRGVIEAFRYSSRGELLASALRTAEPLLACMTADGRIPGRLDRNWQPAAPWSCLTGAAQLAACWFLLADITGQRKFSAAARAANGYVRRAVSYAGDADIVGAVKGSFPIDGGYAPYKYPNWATKFFVDANALEMAEQPSPRSHP
jgi:hypothetical protein